ncbi:MAG: biosynthetic-type acetolactate synthase large subunit [Peptococcales bacterium]|jgi:acetolactate synthase-1/2/3 large subunit
MKMNGAQVLVRALEDQGVDIVFGYPGGAVLEIFDALEESPIDLVLVRHEQGGAHAASGYARALGRPGVCIATSGPGATNLVTGIATAYMDSIPLVVITGQVPKVMVGTDAFQEVDITGITSPITKYNYLVQDVGSLSKIVAEAFYIAASGRPGPVLIDIPRDVSLDITEYKPYTKVDIRSYKPTLKGHPTMIKNALKLLIEAQKPLICTGGGVVSSGASAEVKQLAEKTGARVVSTLMGLGSFPGNDASFLGMLGTYGNYSANMAVQNCDCFLALGMRFDDRVVGNPEKFAPNAKVIHIDIDPAEICKNISVDVPIVGDIKNILQNMLEQLGEFENPGVVDNQKEKSSVVEGLNVPWVLKNLNKIAPEDLIITTDVGQHQLWTAQHFTFNMPRSFISSGGLGTMGYGIPAALGAQLAQPDKKVVVITGDGSFQMGMPELGTIAELNLPIKIIIFNNGTLGMVRQLQHHYCGRRYTGVNFQKTLDFMYLAKAYGAEGFRIKNVHEVPDVLEKALNNNKFTIIECPINPQDLVLPIVLGSNGLDEMEL